MIDSQKRESKLRWKAVYVAVTHNGAYVVGMAVCGVGGFQPMEKIGTFREFSGAFKRACAMNLENAVPDTDVAVIIASTFKTSPGRCTICNESVEMSRIGEHGKCWEGGNDGR